MLTRARTCPFAAPPHTRPVLCFQSSGEEEESDDEDDAAIEFPMPPMPWLIAGSAAVALVALAFIISNDRVEPQPYCSQQPDWNQYNCIPG